MNCEHIDMRMGDFLDKALDQPSADRFEAHLLLCTKCAGKVARARYIHAAIKSMPVPQLPHDSRQRLLQQIRSRSSTTRTGNWRAFFQGASAATLILGLGLIFWQQITSDLSHPTMPATASQQPLAANTQTVQLVFDSSKALHGVTLTLELPEGVEAQEFPGLQQISWQVDIDAGANVLSLPLYISAQERQELVAHIEHGTSRKTFRVPIQPAG